MQKNISDLPAFIRGTSKQKSLKNLTKPQLESLRNQFVTLKHLDAYLQCLGKDPTALYEDFMSLSTTSHERHVLDILRVGKTRTCKEGRTVEMKKYIVPSIIAIASAMAICLCILCRGRKAKAKPENEG